MSEKNRGIMLALLVAIEGVLLALIAFAGMDQLIDFGGGFGIAMVVLGIVETIRRISSKSSS